MLMRRLRSIVIGSVVAFIALQVAVFAGDTWQLQAAPWAGVEVKLPGDKTLTGSLSRSWTGDWILISDGGEELKFTDFESMSFEKASAASQEVGQWREWAPPALVVVLYMLWLFAPALKVLASRGPGDFK